MGVATKATMPPQPLLIRACLGEAVERTPVWAMRQAGRWDPEFVRLRGKLSFYEFSHHPELSAAASLCPLRFGVDAIILFYDITTLAEAMGQEFELVPQRGPVPLRPIASTGDVARLSDNPDPGRYGYVLEALRLVRRELGGSLPILAFAGAPFTLATYQIGAGKDLTVVRRFLAERSQVWNALLEKTAGATIAFLKSLQAAGAATWQLFDSWAGGLSRDEYLAYAQPWHRQIVSAAGGISILFVKDCPYLDLALDSGANVVSLGTVHDLQGLRQKFPNQVFQGNVDHRLLVNGTPEQVTAATRECLKAGGGHRHVLNLDHGMDPAARPENFAAFIDAAH